jgi:hypothetical protein
MSFSTCESLRDVCLAQDVDKFFSLAVPGLAEKRPSVLVGEKYVPAL